MGVLRRGDYECGLRCRRNETLPALFICEATEKPIDPIGLEPNARALQSLHERCMGQIAGLHRREFLMIPFRGKLWLGLGDSEDERDYARFTEAVDCLSATSTDVVPQLDMSPIVFGVYFDLHAEYLGLPYRL